MAEFVSQGIRWSNCVGFSLRTRLMVDPLVWHLFFEICSESEATHVGFFQHGARLDDPSALTHVARVIGRSPDFRKWRLDHKLGCEIGRYRSTVAEMLEGIRPSRHDRLGDAWAFSRWRRGEDPDVKANCPRPLRTTGARPDPSAWYCSYLHERTSADLPSWDPSRYRTSPGGARYVRQ